MERNAPELNFCKSHVFFAAVRSSILAPVLCQALDHVQDRVECTSLRVARTVGNSARRNCRPWRTAMLRHSRNAVHNLRSAEVITAAGQSERHCVLA